MRIGRLVRSLLVIAGLSSAYPGHVEGLHLGAVEAKGEAVKVGTKAPDFNLPSQEGKMISSAEFYGKKPVVVYFYPKDETPVCTKEACAFRDSFQDFKDAGVEVIGVSSDSPDSHKKFAEKHRLPFTLLADQKGELRKAFGVPSTFGVMPGRVTYVIDKDGVVKYIFNSQLEGEKHMTEALRVVKDLHSEKDKQ